MIEAAFAAGLLIAVSLLVRLAYVQGYRAGQQDGADGLANAYLEAAARAPDPFEAWPVERRQEARPS